MGFLKRLLGGGGPEPEATPFDQAEVDADERARGVGLARGEQDRPDDLVRRPQPGAPAGWTPPAQGGDRRAGDEDDAGGAS